VRGAKRSSHTKQAGPRGRLHRKAGLVGLVQWKAAASHVARAGREISEFDALKACGYSRTVAPRSRPLGRVSVRVRTLRTQQRVKNRCQ
jgi:hypothetical protein